MYMKDAVGLINEMRNLIALLGDEIITDSLLHDYPAKREHGLIKHNIREIEHGKYGSKNGYFAQFIDAVHTIDFYYKKDLKIGE